MTLSRTLTIVVAVLAFGPFLGGGAGLAVGAVAGLEPPLAHAPLAATAGSPFAFVSNFENHTLGNWTATSGTAAVTTTPNYLGEPSLASASSAATGGTPQIDQASSGIVPGASAISFQVELNYAHGGTGFFGLAGPHG